MNQLLESISSKVAEFQSLATDIRHFLHERPELKWNEFETSKYLRHELEKIEGVSLGKVMAETGFVARIVGADGPTVALRADMDALPIEESTGLSYASKNEGIMHACGHDGHMANLLVVVKIVASLRQYLKGDVVFIFQPAEEQGGGARKMVEAGCLEGVDEIYGMHGWPDIPLGSVASKPGVLMAASSIFKMTIHGKGGHAAMPHLAIDPVYAAAQCITQTQAHLSRFVEPALPRVLTFSQVSAKSGNNVIPAHVDLGGIARSASDSGLKQVEGLLENVAKGLEAAHGVRIDLEWQSGYPAVENTSECVEQLQQLVTLDPAPARFEYVERPTMGAEDFAYYLKEKPGCFFFLGLDETNREQISLHHPKFDFNDKAFIHSIPVFCRLAFKHSLLS